MVLILAILGVALGVATLTLTQAVLNGFEKTFQESILGFSAHLAIPKDGEMKDLALEERKILQGHAGEVVATTPYLFRSGLMVAHGRDKGVLIKGIDPLTFSRVYAVKVRPWAGAQVPAKIEDLLKNPGEVPPLVLGADLAEELGIQKPGETVKVFLPKEGEEGFRNFQLFRVAGIFSTGFYEFDHNFAFVDLKRLQGLLAIPDVVTGLELKLKDPLRADELAKEFNLQLGPLYEANSWQEINGPFFKALRLERIVFFVIMAMVVAVAAFNIVGVLLLMIFQKVREISILKAMGVSYANLKKLFGMQGLAIGTLGCFLGVFTGAFVTWVLKNTHAFRLAKEVYFVGELPVELSGWVILAVVGVSLMIAFLATQWAVARLKKVPLDL